MSKTSRVWPESVARYSKMITGAPIQSNVRMAELPLFRSTLPAVAAAGDRLVKLLGVLSDRQWHTARELAVHGFTPRELRELVDGDRHFDVLSYPGSPGYKAFEFATLDEIEKSAALRNQARRLLRRFIGYRNRVHRGRPK